MHNVLISLLKNNYYSRNLIKRLRLQVYYLTPKRYFVRKKWRKSFSYPLNLKTPSTYNEKLLWQKIHSNNELARICCDKLAVRRFVEDKIGGTYLNDIVGEYNNTHEIDMENLPNSFVMKATHDHGSVLIVRDKTDIGISQMDFIEQRLKRNYGLIYKEWVYDRIIPRVVIEKFLESDDGKPLRDYKVFCFNGEPKLIMVDVNRFENLRRNIYDTNWNRLKLEIDRPQTNEHIGRPELLDHMLDMSRCLAEPFNHVRVDWYICQNKLIFGEMTFFPGSGMSRFSPVSWEEIIGNWFDVSRDLSY